MKCDPTEPVRAASQTITFIYSISSSLNGKTAKVANERPDSVGDELTPTSFLFWSVMFSNS